MPDDRPLTIPATLERAARLFGDRRAYVEGERGVTWSETWRRAQDAAAGLVAVGLQKGDRVAICAENSINWIVAYHAVAMAGGCGILVYFELKPGEIVEQVSRPGSRFLVASASVLAKLPDGVPGVETVILAGDRGAAGMLRLSDVAAKATDASRAELASRAPAPDDLAAIIYTSGTTGGAKGVMLTHRNFLANGHAIRQHISFGSDESVLLVLPLHHAMTFIATVVLPALVGAHFIIENDLLRLRDRLREYKPTIFFGVPALYELLYRNILARAEAEGRLATLQKGLRISRLVKRLTGLNIGALLFKQVHEALGGRLRFLVSGGAALNPQTALDYFALGLPLLQGWGMTEAAPAIALQSFSPWRFRFTRYYERHAGSVGPALPGIELRLIDVPDKGITVAETGQGEVIVRGENLFRGYWQAEAETRAVLVDGWLHTGDLGRIGRDGAVWLTGRSKYVIVLESGEKVFPDEVEDKLRESVLLEDVCVVGRKPRERTQVVAIVYANVEAARARAAEAGVDLDEAALRRFVAQDVERLGRELAAYKRIANVELTDAPLPKTALRKVARGRIRETYDFNYETWLASSTS